MKYDFDMPTVWALLCTRMVFCIIGNFVPYYIAILYIKLRKKGIFVVD